MSDQNDIELLENACSSKGGDESVVKEILSRKPHLINKVRNNNHNNHHHHTIRQ